VRFGWAEEEELKTLFRASTLGYNEGILTVFGMLVYDSRSEISIQFEYICAAQIGRRMAAQADRAEL
jgi:hypothetical protein